ncbi:hypothetical protein AAFF_G00060860 [Aldrovandia affinis]|uniref:Ig-like domain-containing protein n=1 Tax=Aldrovandia affinis TaxID=143900 RepID=A0AAD7RZU2_9TELE|nr:hypothetical protein AAFF_G00060860 [Aldrovandia affinis]
MKRKHAGALICMLTALAVPLSAASAGDFSVSVPSAPVSVWLGDSVTLPCSVTPPMDVSPLEVRWYRPPHHHAPFLLYKDRRIDPSSQDNKYQGRVFLVGLGSGVGGLEGGNVSLSLRNVTMADSGAYECYVGSLQWYDVGRISLQVNKLGSIPVLSVHPGVGGQQVNVSCVSDGWSPKPSLIWRNREGRELKDQQGLFYSTDPQGLVTVSGWLLFSPSDSGWLSCTVSLSGGDSREGRVAPHTPGTDESVGWIARFITLLVLSVSAISVVTVLFIRSRKTTEKDKKIQAATLRSVMGSECRHVYRHNLNLSVAGTGDPVVILDELEKYFKPAKNTIYERYVFGSCKQEEGESIDNFVTRLRERAATCEYGQLKDEMIRDKIVLGVANESIRRRLLREKGLTLITAIEMCRAAEQTDIRMRAMDMATTSPPHTEAVHAVAKQHSRQKQWKQSNPPRTGDTGLVQFTIPGDVLKVEHAQPEALSKEQLINKYRNVFNSPVESVPGEVHFDLDPNVPAVQSAPRNVPIAMKAAVKAQLDKYEADGHIAPVTDPTDWISNMCKLDYESSLMTTFWTPWGRKRWLKLPFGVSVAPEVYQRKQHELLAGLKGIEPIADDILVVGCGDTDKEAERP